MLNEFYDYIAKNILSFFQNRVGKIECGERYCLKLDNEEMVNGVYDSLKNVVNVHKIQGNFKYGEVYSTFTIKLKSDMEIVVASKINGMTDDFLATLRNAELTYRNFPILMITYSTIDTITSGTGDLSANGMPFHAKSIVSKIENDIKNAQLSVAEKTLLEYELERKQLDRFSDKSSLFEYSNLLAIIGREFVQMEDYYSFGLLKDPEVEYIKNERQIRERLDDNHKLFDYINNIVKYGNISDDLEKDFDARFISYLENCKKRNIPWYEEYTYKQIKTFQDKLRKKLDNPLNIKNSEFKIYSVSPQEYSFLADEQFFIRDDGVTKAKSRKKNIIVYNPDYKESITIDISTNITVPKSDCEVNGCDIISSSKLIRIKMSAEGCTFAQVKITDRNNSITYTIKICVINIQPKYFENIQTSYTVNVPSNSLKGRIQVYGITKALILNPGCDDIASEIIVQNGVYECSYNKTINLILDEEVINTDTGHTDCQLKFGSIMVPIRIQDEIIKPIEITGTGAFKEKFKTEKSLEYRDGKIIAGTTEFFTKEPYRELLSIENEMLEKEWLAVRKTVNGLEEYHLNVTDDIRLAYIGLLKAYKKRKTLPSLAYYDDDLINAAQIYVKIFEREYESIEDGVTLNEKLNNSLLIGCVIQDDDDESIKMSPLHPLNIMYQIALLNEEKVGNVRNNLIEKLNALYLIPFIKDNKQTTYQTIEQKDAPEWRYYAPITSKRYKGSRNFIKKLVCDKIKQYREHFSFLFDDIDNNQLIINLVNMGDCREVLQGLMFFYSQNIKKDVDPDDLLNFVINIYNDKAMYNEFFLLSDQHKLKKFIKEFSGNEDINDLLLAMTGKIRCFFRSPDEAQYQYAHLTFYEMPSEEDTGASRMDSIATGVSLNGLISVVPSVLNSNWYKTGFGKKYAKESSLTKLATYYNAMYRVAFSGSSYESSSCIFTEIKQGQEGQMGKIYDSSNWVVFVDPKVDLSFFQKKSSEDNELMIIHYSDQYTSASGYDDITVTQKSSQYNDIIYEQLHQKGVEAKKEEINKIINLFNAINGEWLLRLVTAKKREGAADSYFSREKMSILSAIKVCMAYYNHPDIVWIPISLEEILRVSGGAGLSQKDGLLSAKNLGFEHRPTSDDILMVGIEGPEDQIKIYIHPVEVKIGQNEQAVVSKANEQVLNTYNGLWNSLWPDEERNILERKISRNFFIQLLLVCCEKMKIYNIYPNEKWDDVLDLYRESLLNERYEFSNDIDQYIGKGTIISFGESTLNISGEISNDICLLKFPENMGSLYMVLSTNEIEQDLELYLDELPAMLKKLYLKQVEKEANYVENTGNIIGNIRDMISEKEDCDIKPILSVDRAADSLNEFKVDQDADIQTLNNDEEEDIEEEKMNGMQIIFGQDIISGQSLIWEPNNTNQLFHTNTGIIGTMGTGKTQFTKSLITQLYLEQSKNIGDDPLGVLIFDYKGDYNESKEDFVNATNAMVLKPYHLPFNPLALTKSKVFKPLLPIHTANAFKDTLAKVYNLGPKQQNTLFQCIIDAYASKGIIPSDSSTWDNTPPTFDTVYSLYMNNDEIKKNDSLAAAMDKLKQFEIFEANAYETKSLFELLNGVVVIDLSGYDSDIQSLIVAISLDLFYSQMQAAGSSKLEGQLRQLTKLILVDEADNFMSEGFSALKKILKEGREFGVGTILSTQFLKHFGSGDDDYAKYILTWVVHNVADLKNSDVEFVFQTEAKSTECQTLYNDIKALKKHYSIVKISNQKPQYIKDKAFWQLYSELNSD